MESIKQEQSKYKQTRKRVTNFYNNRDMSDKEIIESLYDEIEQYKLVKIQPKEVTLNDPNADANLTIELKKGSNVTISDI